MTAALAIVLGGVDVTAKVEMATVSMQLAGSQETAMCEFDLIDTANSVSATDEETLTVTEVGTSEVLFGGFVRSRRITVINTGRLIHLTAVDYNSLLDRSIVVSDSRTAGESDHTRLVYLMTTYGTQFSSDYSLIATLNASLPAQKFVAITLRQAIERVLGQASQKSSYYVDPTGRLVTYDRTVITAAPYNVRVGTPGGGELAPEDFSVDNDASNLANAIYIVGATAAGSGWFTDVTSIAAYGRRERFFNAPDSDTHAKARQVGLAVLEDQKDPVPRGVFTTRSPYDGWRIGQSTVVNSTQHGLTDVTYRIARVTVHYLTGAGHREYQIEIGAPLPTLTTLLASAHGGGGGYPWTSPGGSGNWTPLPGQPTTVTSDGCGGCPPYVDGLAGSVGGFYDYFGRSAIPIGSPTNNPAIPVHWDIAGTSSSGHSYGPAGYYVGTGYGVLMGDLGGLGSVAAATTGVSEFTEARFRLEMDFSFRPYTTADFAGDNRQDPMSSGMGDYTVSLALLSGLGDLLSCSVAVGGTYILKAGGLTATGSIGGAMSAGSTYSLVWTVDSVAATSTIEIAGFSATLGSGAVSHPRSLNITALATTAHTITHITRIESFGATPASPGQQVNHEVDGTGNGSTTTFTTRFPYRSGGIVVKANGIDVTDSITAFNPTAGTYTFAVAPATGTEITANYVAGP